MENLTCKTCFRTKNPSHCGLCNDVVCKQCAQAIDEETFNFLPKLPVTLKLGVYCGSCYQEHVAPLAAEYQQTMELAQEVQVFGKTQTRETRTVKRNQELLQVKDCEDRSEVVLRLAFLAAKNQFNALVDVEITPTKIMMGTYQKQVWSGVGRPALKNR